MTKQTAAKSFVDRALGYGVHGASCDGNDVFAVYEMTKQAVEHARAGKGAALLEVMTYRRKGHAEHDGQQYVPSGEIELWAAKDPVDRFETRVRQEGWLTDDELAQIRTRVSEEVDAARAEAEASPMPAAEEALCSPYGDRPVAAPWTRHTQPDPHSA